MEATKPVKFEITKGNRIVATMSNGYQQGWTDSKTVRGAKSRLTFWAKRYGLVKSADGMSASVK